MEDDIFGTIKRFVYQGLTKEEAIQKAESILGKLPEEIINRIREA